MGILLGTRLGAVFKFQLGGDAGTGVEAQPTHRGLR